MVPWMRLPATWRHHWGASARRWASPVEAGALEEAFPGVGHAPFHLGLVPGMPHPGRVNEEAPVLGVFQEAPAQARMQGVRPHHYGGEIVDDQVFGHAAEEGPGRLQSGDRNSSDLVR